MRKRSRSSRRCQREWQTVGLSYRADGWMDFRGRLENRRRRVWLVGNRTRYQSGVYVSTWESGLDVKLSGTAIIKRFITVSSRNKLEAVFIFHGKYCMRNKTTSFLWLAAGYLAYDIRKRKLKSESSPFSCGERGKNQKRRERKWKEKLRQFYWAQWWLSEWQQDAAAKKREEHPGRSSIRYEFPSLQNMVPWTIAGKALSKGWKKKDLKKERIWK